MTEKKKPVSDAQKKASDRYQKANIRRYVLKLNQRTEAPEIAHIEKQGNINAYLKALIRKDMEQ